MPAPRSGCGDTGSFARRPTARPLLCGLVPKRRVGLGSRTPPLYTCCSHPAMGCVQSQEAACAPGRPCQDSPKIVLEIHHRRSRVRHRAVRPCGRRAPSATSTLLVLKQKGGSAPRRGPPRCLLLPSRPRPREVPGLPLPRPVSATVSASGLGPHPLREQRGEKTDSHLRAAQTVPGFSHLRCISVP